MTRIAGVLVGVALSALAAAPDTTKQTSDRGLTAMKKIAFLTGRWEGEGWMRFGPGEPQRFRSSEVVEPRVGGRVLTIVGQHWDRATDRLVHDAFAIVSPDTATGGYRFQSFLADGRTGTYPGRVDDGAFVWEMTTPRGDRIRYTIRITGDEWKEVGERYLEGATWREFFGMTLKRTP